MTGTTLRRLLLPLGCSAIALGCGRGAGDEAEAGGRGLVTAETMVLTPQPFETTIEAVGTVVSRLGHSAAIAAPVSVRITRVLVVAGQRVRTGETLIELDRTEIDAAVRSADAAVVASDAAAVRAERLVAAGILPRRDAEVANVEAARAREEAASARRTADLARIRAPFDGVVTRVSAAQGATADPGIPLVELADPSAIDILFAVTTANAGSLRLGQHVVLLGATPDDSLGVGTITDIGGVVDSLNRSVSVRASASGARRPLRIGETLTGHVTIGSTMKALVVPVAALVPSGEGFHVFVVDSAGMAHLREVTVDGQHDGLARISDGLVAGERIVTTGAYGLDDSVMVAAPGAKPTRP